MKSLISKFFKDESGATAIEYGLIAAGIAIAIITAVQGVGTQLSTQHLHFAEVTGPFRGQVGAGRVERPALSFLSFEDRAASRAGAGQRRA